jgi:tetraacyldisaccharide 4'-kinase
MSLPGVVYGLAARARRRWFSRHPHVRRKLLRPVISVGNLSVGGSGKTPVVSHLAKLLLSAGEKPSILSRGYGRLVSDDGVVVVSDGRRILADLGRAGDEPLMLARSLPGVPVLVASERYLAGRLAEHHFGCSVHLLDDGFQHFQLERSLDLVLVDVIESAGDTPLPSGRLREQLDTLSLADALVVPAGQLPQGKELAERMGVSRVFGLERRLLPAMMQEPLGSELPIQPGPDVVSVAGIAHPRRFAEDLRRAGWSIAAELTFQDHHPYSPRDVERILETARSAGAELVLTTEKDYVRLLPYRPFRTPVAYVPLEATIEPAVPFREWLAVRLAGARELEVTGAATRLS